MMLSSRSKSLNEYVQLRRVRSGITQILSSAMLIIFKLYRSMSWSTVSHTTMLSGGTLHGTELTLQLCWASPCWRTTVVRKFPVASHLLIVMDATTTRHRTAVLRHTVVSTCWSGNLSSMPRVIACIGSDALLNSIWVSGSGTTHLRPGTWDSESHAMSTK